jgi:PleD family two-component response regulator
MPAEVVVLIFTALLGGLSLGGLEIVLRARAGRRRELKHEEVERLSETVEGLQEQMSQVRDAVTDLHERVDFAERLLTKGEKGGQGRSG